MTSPSYSQPSDRIKRLVFGRFEFGKWRTEEIVTKRVMHRKRGVLCHECRRLIYPDETYYSDGIYYRNREYAGILGFVERCRKHHHVVCRGCWRGEGLAARGTLTKFIDRSRPRGSKIVGVKPFKARA